MSQSKKYLGILTFLTKKRHRSGSSYYVGSIECPEIPNKIISFDQNSLRSTDVKKIEKGLFIFFKIKISEVTNKENKNHEQLDAINCTLNTERIILRDIIQYDLETIKFVIKHATEELKTKLVSKIESVKSESPISEVLLKIESIKKEGLSIVKESVSQSFLETLFKANTLEYNQNLLHILVEGLKIIDNEDVFQQAKFLLRFNTLTANTKIENLNSIFYQKATDKYKFRLWFEKLIDYCSTEILKYNFDKADLDFKTEIIQRCQGNENGFLLLHNQTKNNSKIEVVKQLEPISKKELNNEVKDNNEIEDIYFSGIREKLLQELTEAKRRIVVAVAWFTNDDLFDVLCKKLDDGIKVELIIVNDYINNWIFGLPFQTFINLGGKLYLSNHPNMMHHKFCLIDNETIFNGSYNWTYYAEMRNDENIMLFKNKPKLMRKFKAEFKKLKLKLGDPVVKIEPFDRDQIDRFEKIAFKQYFSTDLTFRAQKMKEKNILRANELTTTALFFDIENAEAKTFQQEIELDVELEQRAVQVGNIITKKIDIDSLKELSIPSQTSNTTLPQTSNTTPLQTSNTTLPQTSNTTPLQTSNTTLPQTRNTTPPQTRNTTPPQTRNTTPPQTSNTTLPQTRNTTPPQTRNTIPQTRNTTPQTRNTAPIPQNYSAPVQKIIKKPFQNMQVAIALDISSSMNALYNNGTVQKVVEKLLSVALFISYNNELDIWTFNTSAKRLTSASSINLKSYIANNGILPSGGTDVSQVLNDINKKYFQESNEHNIFAIILTDGDIGDVQDIIVNSSLKPVFWQFVGLGTNFAQLDTLNNINKNVSFFSLNDISTISDNELYQKLLAELPNWYKESQIRGIIK